MACGTPVIVSDKTAVPEIADYGAVHFDPQNGGELKEKIYQLLHNKELRKSMISRGIKRSREFSWEKNAQETVDLIKRASTPFN
jgi:glycosyltransferase involved in cell wall biosynthesis